MQNRYFILCLLFTLTALPFVGMGQGWKTSITLKDRREGGELPDVAKVDLSAYYMTSRLAPGDPISSGGPINFPAINEGFIKFKIDNITWIDEEFDKSPEYKVVVRSLWVDMKPRVWQDIRVPGQTTDQLRRSFINAPNVEYIFGDSMPPPFIFKVNQNDNYTFTVGFKVLTPSTDREKPFPFSFSFNIRGLLRDAAQEVIVEEVVPDTNDLFANEPLEEEENFEPEEEDNTADIDEAVARAIEQQDADALMSLIRDYPEVQSVKDARIYLSLNLRRELVDSVEYKIDIEYERFSRSLPTRSQVNLSFERGGRVLSAAERPYMTWKGDELHVRPPRNNQDYTLVASIKATPDLEKRIVLNSVRDFINFSYADTLEGDFVKMRVKGGQGPYTLLLERNNDEDFFKMEGSTTIYGDTVMSKDRLSAIFKLSDEADYRLIIVDSDQLKKTGKTLIHIVPPPPIPPVVWYASGVGLLLFFVGYRFWVASQRRKDEELQKLIEARGGLDPKVKRKPKPNLVEFWNETSISDLSLHQNFIDEIATYLRERKRLPEGAKPSIEGIILGTVLKFDFENEQYEVRLDRFRSVETLPLDHYDEVPDREKWPEIREVIGDHRNLVKIGWLQVVEDKPMRLGKEELQFQDEQFSELFQLCLKVDIQGNDKLCGFFTRTISGKINNEDDRRNLDGGWMDWDKLEDAGYYENTTKPVKQASETNIAIKKVNERAEWA